jgi:hypothetical protein
VSAFTVLTSMVEYLLNTPRSPKMFKEKDFKKYPAMLAERDSCISALMNLKSVDLGGDELVAKEFFQNFSALVDIIWVCSRHYVAHAYSWNVYDENCLKSLPLYAFVGQLTIVLAFVSKL